MKKLIFIISIFASMMLPVGCASNSEGSVDEEEKVYLYDGEPIFNLLNEEQRKYLIETQRYTEDRINLMHYEAVNYELLGTGLELYNQSSGIERFGLTYAEEEVISEKSNSEDIITLKEVKEIRNKEEKMRLNDFIQYKYELTEYDNNRYGMKLPLGDYDNTYVSIGFTRNDDGTVHMEAPIISYKNGADGYAFSILYDEETLRQFYEEDEKYTIEGKHYIEIQHTSITDNSLIVEILNWTDKQLKVVPNYKVYEIDGDKEILITSVEGDEDTINGKSYSIKSVKLEEGKKFEKGKKYIVKYGKNSWGYFYDEIEFVR